MTCAKPDSGGQCQSSDLAMTTSCNGGGEATAGEFPSTLCGRSPIDARAKTGTAPDEHSDMRESANQSLITDVSRLRLHRCTTIASIPTVELAARALSCMAGA